MLCFCDTIVLYVNVFVSQSFIFGIRFGDGSRPCQGAFNETRACTHAGRQEKMRISGSHFQRDFVHSLEADNWFYERILEVCPPFPKGGLFV